MEKINFTASLEVLKLSAHSQWTFCVFIPILLFSCQKVSQQSGEGGLLLLPLFAGKESLMTQLGVIERMIWIGTPFHYDGTYGEFIATSTKSPLVTYVRDRRMIVKIYFIHLWRLAIRNHSITVTSITETILRRFKHIYSFATQFKLGNNMPACFLSIWKYSQWTADIRHFDQACVIIDLSGYRI